jgi:hypothetical protein
MIIDYYEKYPDQDEIIVHLAGNDHDDDDGSGNMSAGACGSEGNSDDKD